MKRFALLLIAVSMLMTTGCCWHQPCGPGGCPPGYGAAPGYGAVGQSYYGPGTAQAVVPTYAANPYVAPQTAGVPLAPLQTY